MAGQVVRGYFAYHAVPTNSRSLSAFRFHVTELWRRTLRRRSQRDRSTWARMTKLEADFLPLPRFLQAGHPLGWTDDKTDAEGQGRAAYLSRATVRWLKMWLENAGIDDGAVFRRLTGSDKIGRPLNPGSTAPIFRRMAQWVGMPEPVVAKVSGHSTRVGAAQDLAALDIDLAAITQAGGVEVYADAVTVCGED